MAWRTGVSGASRTREARMNAHSLVERDLVPGVPGARASAQSASVPAEFGYRYGGYDREADQLHTGHTH